nr:type II toxin-antitoxin system PemK/MazF family toxin [Rubrobacter aplysinae]
MVIRRGEIWWAGLSGPEASEPGYRRPVLIVQSDEFNESRIGTVIAAALTTNLRLAEAPGNVPVEVEDTGLSRESVVNVSQLVTVDRSFLVERAGRVEDRVMLRVDDGIRLVLAL